MLNDDIFKKEYKLGWSFKSYHHLKTPLVLAVDSKSKKIVKLLLKSGVDVFEEKFGDCALKWAIEMKNNEAFYMITKYAYKGCNKYDYCAKILMSLLEKQ